MQMLIEREGKTTDIFVMCLLFVCNIGMLMTKREREGSAYD